MATAGELCREDVLQLISEILAEHLEVDWASEGDAAFADARARANHVFNRLFSAGWLSERDLGLDDRRVIVEPTIRWLLDAFRKMSAVGRAEVHSFADTLRGVCDELTDADSFDPARRSSEEMVARLRDLSRRTETATHQISHVYLVLRRFIDRQGQTMSARANLRLVYRYPKTLVLAGLREPDYFVAMSTVTEIKQAVSKLPPRKKLALVRWLQAQVDDRLNDEELMAIAAEGARALDRREAAYAKRKAR